MNRGNVTDVGPVPGELCVYCMESGGATGRGVKGLKLIVLGIIGLV